MLDTMTHGIPKKVLATARVLGIHNDCLQAGPEGACPTCIRTMHESFSIHYAHLGNSNDIESEILADLLLDQWDE